ncbi:TetR/AcrR family transcriptional regulator [Spirosoma spitsbergense]|uniref:TetR/AcrR family transcriptional regulator n=1 Tax=Spirosoma spitsbergense TaxID=431554 RepID=UPI000376F80E|nr:TetR/AcrR family transcriptional regulator [Spirosoma spitsbergense]
MVVQDTESKIREVARRVFLENGYEGAKIRQIADEAGVNLAMVNYYFRSKEQLFKSIYLETFREFIGRIAVLVNEETPLEVKIWKIVDRYTDFILENPSVPMFILAEQRQEGSRFFEEMNVKALIEGSYFRRQLVEEAEKGHIRSVEPLQIIVTIMSNIIFPIMARPVISYVGSLDNNGFQQFIEARKQMVPEMIMAWLRLP